MENLDFFGDYFYYFGVNLRLYFNVKLLFVFKTLTLNCICLLLKIFILLKKEILLKISKIFEKNLKFGEKMDFEI